MTHNSQSTQQTRNATVLASMHGSAGQTNIAIDSLWNSPLHHCFDALASQWPLAVHMSNTQEIDFLLLHSKTNSWKARLNVKFEVLNLINIINNRRIFLLFQKKLTIKVKKSSQSTAGPSLQRSMKLYITIHFDGCNEITNIFHYQIIQEIRKAKATAKKYGLLQSWKKMSRQSMSTNLSWSHHHTAHRAKSNMFINALYAN